MGWRFNRRFRLFPGVTLNVGKESFSFSVGPRGAKYTVGTKGSRFTIGLPGTGLFYTVTDKDCYTQNEGKLDKQSASLPLSFLQKMTLPKDEIEFTEACYEISRGNFEDALSHAIKATNMVDGAFLAASLYSKNGDFFKAKESIDKVINNIDLLGIYFKKYGISITITLDITEEEKFIFHGANVININLIYLSIYEDSGEIDKCLEIVKSLISIFNNNAALKFYAANLISGKSIKANNEYCYILKLYYASLSNGRLQKELEEKFLEIATVAAKKIIQEKLEYMAEKIEGLEDGYTLPSTTSNQTEDFELLERILTIENSQNINTHNNQIAIEKHNNVFIY